MSTLAGIAKELHKNAKMFRFGGIETFFGRLNFFEELLEEEHAADKEASKDTGMFRYKGMNQYGNIVTAFPSIMALVRAKEEFEFTREYFVELQNWYANKNTPDCATLSVIIKWFLGMDYKGKCGAGTVEEKIQKELQDRQYEKESRLAQGQFLHMSGA